MERVRESSSLWLSQCLPSSTIFCLANEYPSVKGEIRTLPPSLSEFMDYIVFEAVYGLRPFSSPSSPYPSVPGAPQVGPQPGSEAIHRQVRKGEVGKREGNVREPKRYYQFLPPLLTDVTCRASLLSLSEYIMWLIC